MEKSKKQSEQDKKENGSVRERYIKLLKKTEALREFLGPKAYPDLVESLDVDILEWIEEDLKRGRFIEAYALTDQYVDTLLKWVFFEIFDNEIIKKKSNSRNYQKIETVLRILVKIGKMDSDFFKEYRDFKSTRDDLIHKSIFSPGEAKEFENIPKTKSLPGKIIKDTEALFLDKFNPIYDWLSSPDIPKAKLENELKIFLAFWVNAKRHNTNKSLKKIMEDISNKLEEEINKTKR